MQPSEATLLFNELLRFLETRQEAQLDVLVRQDLIRRVGYGGLAPEINWLGSAREWCLSLLSVLAGHGQKELVGFLTGLELALDLGTEDLDQLRQMRRTFESLSREAFYELFASAFQ